MKYIVTIAGSEKQSIIEANSELEAKIKYCQQEGLLYRVYMNKLTVRRLENDEN